MSKFDITIEMIDYIVATLPEHILESSHFKNWREIFPEEHIFPCYNNIYLENLEIRSQEDLDKIIECESVFIFNTKFRIEIFKNMYKYWSEYPSSSPIKLPDKCNSWFSGQVATLFSERDATIASTCFKRNYVDLFDYLLERDGLDQIDNGGLYSLYSLPYYGVMNNHVEIVRRGLEVGCNASMDLFDVAIEKRNLEMFKLLLEFKVIFTKKTLIIAAKFGLPEIYEHFLKESRKMNVFPEYVIETLKNLDNLKFLLIQHGSTIDGLKLLGECLQNAYDLNVITLLEEHYGSKIIDQIQSNPEYKYINISVIKKDDYELYTYLRSKGFLVIESLIVGSLYHKSYRISPGLLKKHKADDLEKEREHNRELMEEEWQKERDEEDAADRAEYEYEMSKLDKQQDEMIDRNRNNRSDDDWN